MKPILFLLPFVVAGCSQAGATPRSYDDVPPITGLMQRQIDRFMVQEMNRKADRILRWIERQERLEATFAEKYHTADLPYLPGALPKEKK